MASFLYARFPDGRILSADSLDPSARADYRDLTCIGCGTRMIPALGQVLRWHYRHEEGEGCAEYYAALAEGLILQGLKEARRTGQSYALQVRSLSPIDLTRCKEVLRGTEIEGRRVDIALVSELNRINIVVARRQDDLLIARDAPGLWVTIDVTDEDEDFISRLAAGIVVAADPRISTENFPDQLRLQDEARRRAEERAEASRMHALEDARRRAKAPAGYRGLRRGPGSRARHDDDLDDLIENEDEPLRAGGLPSAAAAPAAPAPVEDPDRRLPGETHQEHRARMMVKYPWMRRRP